MIEPVEKRRERLRELDSLLEQMLALPISDRPPRIRSVESPASPEPAPEESPPPRPLVWPVRPEPTMPVVQAERVVAFISSEVDTAPRLQPPPDENVRLDRHEEAEGKLDQSSAPADELIEQERWQASLFDPTQVDARPGDGFDLAKEDLLSRVGIPVLDSHPVSVPPRVSPSTPQRLLLAINFVYDRFCDTLWPFSGLLKWSGTKNLLGVIGIILMMAAAVWLIATQFVMVR